MKWTKLQLEKKKKTQITKSLNQSGNIAIDLREMKSIVNQLKANKLDNLDEWTNSQKYKLSKITQEEIKKKLNDLNY